MEQEVKVREVRTIRDIFLDTFYGYFEPVRNFARSLATHHYRVRYSNPVMKGLRHSETFTAMHDREARRLAQKIVGPVRRFEIEQYRPVKHE